MKYCPNPDCPYVIHRSLPAEFLDRANQCNDCGAPLVAKETLGTAEAGLVIATWRDAREREHAAATGNPYRVTDRSPQSSTSHRLDIATGIVLLVLLVVLFAVSYVMSFTSGRGAIVVAFGPFIYGIVRLGRGLASLRD